VAQPRVSVALPVYDGAPFLREAFECWLGQEFGDFELIVSDNASTDATPDIVEEYARRDRRVRSVRRARTVPAYENFNRVVEEARAPLFAWAACDDPRHPAFLARLVEALDRRPEVVLGYPLMQFFGDPARESIRPPPGSTPPGTQRSRAARLLALLRGHEWSLVYGVVRSEVLRRTRLFVWPMGIPPDVGLSLELATHGPFECVPEVLMSFRLHAGSVSARRDDPMFDGNDVRRLDDAARTFINGLELSAAERRLVLREVWVWCRKAQKSRRLLWRSKQFRSAFVHVTRSLNDLTRIAKGL
jgi:glycosyltransferase involved in cell wall biosynthesis